MYNEKKQKQSKQETRKREEKNGRKPNEFLKNNNTKYRKKPNDRY